MFQVLFFHLKKLNDLSVMRQRWTRTVLWHAAWRSEKQPELPIASSTTTVESAGLCFTRRGIMMDHFQLAVQCTIAGHRCAVVNHLCYVGLVWRELWVMKTVAVEFGCDMGLRLSWQLHSRFGLHLRKSCLHRSCCPLT